jgi:tripeptide aminopeptidase
MINEERLVHEFIELVKIDSLSRKEAGLARVLKQKLEVLGLEVINDEKSAGTAGTDGGNLLGILKGNVKGVPTILFAAHMDTVMPGEGICPFVEGSVIKSNGTTILGADDKSGIAAVLEALRHLIEEELPHGDIEVLFTIGEEVGLLGSRYLDYSLLKAKIGFVLDSGGPPGTIINQGPAQVRIKAVITGKTAHAGVNPEDGISAIQVAAKAIDRMKLLRIDEETTANIGVISGGNVTNIVCDSVTIEGEARSLSDDKLERQTGHMLDCLEQACAEFGAKLTVTPERLYPAFLVDSTDSLIELARRAASRAGLKAKVIASGGGSDTNFFNARGIKTLNLGTGMNKVHTNEENIDIKDLTGTARYVAALINEIIR